MKLHHVSGVGSKHAILLQHMRVHMMDEFQCPYCLYGEAERERLLTHLVNCHPGRSGKVLLRKQDHDPNKPASSIHRTTKPLDTQVPNKVSTPEFLTPSAQNAPVANRTSDSLVPSVMFTTPPAPPHSHATAPVGSHFPVASGPQATTSFSIINQAPSDAYYSPVTSITTDVYTTGSHNSNGSLPAAVATGNTASAPDVVQSPSRRRTRSSLSNTGGGSTENIEDDAQPQASEKVGLVGTALYRCGNQGCNFSSPTMAMIREHLQVCDLARSCPTLKCYHCGRQYRHLSALLDHLKVHGPKRYHCGAPGCTYRATMLHYFRNHTRQMHGTNYFKSEVKNPNILEPEDHEFLVTPRDPSSPCQDQHKKRKYEYEVADVDKIPLNHISFALLRCFHCTFSSKIRLNLVKHLRLHQKYPIGIPQRPVQLEVKSDLTYPIPLKQPVNPMPCLERKELMFDKMMNLAGSSFEDKKRMEEVDLRLKNPIPLEEFDNLPQHVADNSLNACGVTGCKYISSDEIMLKYHIRSLHSDVTQFPCPHCKATLITVEKISSHFKLHGEKLFRCGWCPYLSFRRAVVERHMREKHSSKRPFEFVIRDPDEKMVKRDEKKPEVLISFSAGDGTTVEEPQWQCGLCRFQSVTQQAMVNHTSLKHDIKSQYKCGHCNFKSSVMPSFDVHFTAKHVNQPFKVSFCEKFSC